MIASGVGSQVFPGAAACVGWIGADGKSDFAIAAAGRLAPGGDALSLDTPYDLGSLTKSFVAAATLRLVAEGRIDLDTRVDSVLSDVRGGPGGAATFEDLLSHRSGLAAWGGFYLDIPHEPGSAAARRWVLAEAARRMEKKGQMVYSDLGYMILGAAAARAAGVTLDQLVRREVLHPLKIADQVYYAGALPPDKKTWLERCAPPTERCDWRGRMLKGEVHDENAGALGGVAGHAGLFGTAYGVAVFGLELVRVLNGDSDFLPVELLRTALKRRPGGSYGLGFDLKSGKESAAGGLLDDSSFGHLGFPGTSFWCDPSRSIVIVLLSNRVHPSRANEKIKGFRPAFHDALTSIYDRTHSSRPPMVAS